MNIQVCEEGAEIYGRDRSFLPMRFAVYSYYTARDHRAPARPTRHQASSTADISCLTILVYLRLIYMSLPPSHAGELRPPRLRDRTPLLQSSLIPDHHPIRRRPQILIVQICLPPYDPHPLWQPHRLRDAIITPNLQLD